MTADSHSSAPKRTALYDQHAALGARFTDFGGWDMPLKYASELDEHRAVRERVGVFDLSHMGEVLVTGPEAAEFLDHALISKLSAIKVGKAKYSMICTPDGGIIDDLITYRLAEQEFLVVPNAGNVAAVAQALADRAAGAERAGEAAGQAFDVTVDNRSEGMSMVAVQGPRAVEVMLEVVEAVTDAPEGSGAGETVEEAVRGLNYYAAFQGTVAGQKAIIARTGYTGEDGFEIIVANAGAPAVWEKALGVAQRFDGVACGLASRDTLRLEAGMPLYGNELSLDLTPVDAGLGILAATKSKEEFVGRDAIVAAKEQGTSQTLIGLTGEGRRAARGGYTVHTLAAVDGADGTAGVDAGAEIGRVTSGALSPTLGHPVAMAYVSKAAVDSGAAAPGATVEVDIRGKRLPFTVTELPFYTRQK